MIAPIYCYTQQVSILEFILLSVQSSFWSVKWQSLSCIWLFAKLWTVAGQVPLSMEFFRQEYWSGQPFPSPGDLPDSGIKLGSPSLKPDSLPSDHQECKVFAVRDEKQTDQMHEARKVKGNLEAEWEGKWGQWKAHHCKRQWISLAGKLRFLLVGRRCRISLWDNVGRGAHTLVLRGWN